MNTIPLSGIEAFLYAEARALDDRDWDTWLAFYAPDASFWMPAWDDNDRLVENPQAEISLAAARNTRFLRLVERAISQGRCIARLTPASPPSAPQLWRFEKASSKLYSFLISATGGPWESTRSRRRRETCQRH
jgi:hypothetical protein